MGGTVEVTGETGVVGEVEFLAITGSEASRAFAFVRLNELVFLGQFLAICP
jgi:hypothetical protein